MKVTSLQVYVLKESTVKTKALARVLLDDEIQLTGLRVVNGHNGLFVAYPNDPSYKGDDYRSLFYPVTRSLRDHIEETVISKYKEQLDGNGDNTDLDVYRFLMDKDWVTKEEKQFIKMRLEHLGNHQSTEVTQSKIKLAQEDIKKYKSEIKLLSKDLGEKVKAKILKYWGNEAPKLLDHGGYLGKLAVFILKDGTL